MAYCCGHIFGVESSDLSDALPAMSRAAKLFITLLFIPLLAQAQAYKCRTTAGKIVISNEGCQGGSTQEKITMAAPITLDRQRQAAEVAARNAAQLQGIESERAIFNQRVMAQQREAVTQDSRPTNNQNVNACVSRIEGTSGLSQRQKANAIAQCHGANASQNSSESDNTNDCVSRIERMSGLSGRQRASAIAQCHGALPMPEPERPNIPTPQATPAQPMPVIKNCNGNSCSDQFGNRYTETAGKITNSQGQRCHQSGKVMYCD